MVQAQVPVRAFTYEWQDDTGMVIDSVLTVPTTNSGNYILIVANEAAGCYDTAYVTIEEDVAEPNADASGNTIDCNNMSVQVDGQSTTPNVTYGWTGPGGFTSSEEDPLVNQGGSYILTVTSADNGCTTLDTALVFEDLDEPEASASGDTIDCINNTAQLNSSSPSAECHI